MGRALCKLCATKYLGKAFLCQCICVSSFCVQKPSAPDGFCARDFSLTIKAFWRAEQLRWVETNFKEMRKVDQCSDEMKTLRRTYLDDMWEEMGWDEKRWDEVRRGEMRWQELTWYEMRWSAEYEVQVWSVKYGVWRVQCEVWRKCLLGVALRRGRAQVMFLDKHRATQSTHARAWPAHGACKFYRWKRSFSITLRQLLPRLVRVLLVYEIIPVVPGPCRGGSFEKMK